MKSLKKHIAGFSQKVQVLIFLFLIGSPVIANPIDDLLERIDKGASKKIITEQVSSDSEEDFFELDKYRGKVVVRGNNNISIAAGVNWYLKYYANIHLSWNSMSAKLSGKLPLPKQKERHTTDKCLRYYLNYCTFSYSMAFWDWPRWEKEIDWMALHGINLSLSITGNEVVWRNILIQAGYTVDEVNNFVSGPAFMAWWQMNNLEGWGGPNPDEWYENREALQKKIITRMRELGIEPVLPGFAGMIPRNIEKKLGYSVADPGTWCSFNRPAFLKPVDANFDRFASIYYIEMEKLYGKAKYYAIDPFHEGGSTKGIDLGAAGQAVMAAMKRANPEGIWIAQAWQANPRPKMIEQLNTHDLLILDLYSEKMPQWGDPASAWHRKDGYGKHDWLYCMLLNFGGRIGLHGRMDRVINSYYLAKSHANGKNLLGVGATPEGIENNPVMFELLYELPWRQEKFTKEEWLASYITARYGKYDADVYEAWMLLAQHPYNCPDDYPGEGTVESLFCARPSIDPSKVSTWGSSVLFYDPEKTRMAAEKLLSVADKFAGNENFCYDLVDILRQSISDRGNALSKQIGLAWKAKDIKQFKDLSDSFLMAIQCQDKLLATQKNFRLGNWLEQAKSLSTTQKNRDLYEWNARTLITIWGNRKAAENGGLHDYSHREWNGLLSDLYYNRWKLFFDNTVKELEGTNVPPVDFHAIEESWTRARNIYGSEAEGNSVQTARLIYEQVFKNIYY
ncbi:MAG: alpha-N-acetylglucosaminidase [Mediterranea sp.]|jgi:alpha-N-acetylglucosaminidase|nr:alpha-N-acetylglucosaminidase [Mediterranea sp.]